MNAKLTKILILELGKDEADWLLNVCKNPICSFSEDEKPKDRYIRELFFTTIYSQVAQK